MMASEPGMSNSANSTTLSTTPLSQQTNNNTIISRSLKRSRLDFSHDSLSFIANSGLVDLPSLKSPRFHGIFSSKFASGSLSTSNNHEIEEHETPISENSENEGNVSLSSLLPIGDSNTSKTQDTPTITVTMEDDIANVEDAISIVNSISVDDRLDEDKVNTTSVETTSAVVTTSVMLNDNLEQENGNVRPGNVGYSQAPSKELISRQSVKSPENFVEQAQETNAATDKILPIIDQQLSPRPSAQRKHGCPYCEAGFTRYHNLKSHLLTHSQEKPYVCQTCSMRFRRLHDLKRHTKLHTGERPHVCLKCSRKFARSDALARHIKGQGGCAGRRSSIGSFGADDEFEDSNVAENEDEVALNDTNNVCNKPQINYQNDIAEKRQQFILSLQAQHIGSTRSGDSYVPLHSSSIYSSGGSQSRRSSGILHPPPGNSGSSGYVINPHNSVTGLRGYSPSMGIPAKQSKPEDNSVFPQSTINKNSSPLNIIVPQQSAHETTSIAKQTSPALPNNLMSHHFGGRQPSESSQSVGTLAASQRPKLPALTSLTPPDKRFMLASQVSQSNQQIGHKAAAETSSTRVIFSPDAQLPIAHSDHQNPISIESTNSNLFASGEKGVWAYVQTLEDRVKELSDKVQSMESTEKAQEDKINQLSAEILSLRIQLNATNKSSQSKGSGQPS